MRKTSPALYTSQINLDIPPLVFLTMAKINYNLSEGLEVANSYLTFGNIRAVVEQLGVAKTK